MHVSAHKVVIVGNASVGKSSLALRACRNQFFEFQESTMGAAFFKLDRHPDSEAHVKFEIWDTAGQERYRCLAPMYYRGASFGIVVFDVIDAASLKAAETWVDELLKHATDMRQIVLVANKIDLRRDWSEGELWADAMHMARTRDLVLCCASAKTGCNVERIFDDMARFVVASGAPTPIPEGTLAFPPIECRATHDIRPGRCCA